MKIRTLKKYDYEQYLSLINSFRETNFSKIIFEEFYDKINANSEIYVIEEDGIIIGSGTIYYEYKFIRSISKVAHIEDIIIAEKYRGNNYGTVLLIDHLINVSQNNNCYKIILNCSDNLEKFYAKYGLIKNGISMSLYFN
jgi:glucosamine-phosphate N-acetyltransferase